MQIHANPLKCILYVLLSPVMAHDVLERCLQQPTTTSAAWESLTTPKWQVGVIFKPCFGQCDKSMTVRDVSK